VVAKKINSSAYFHYYQRASHLRGFFLAVC